MREGATAPPPIDRMHLKHMKILHQNALFLHQNFKNFLGRGHSRFPRPHPYPSAPYSQFLDPLLLNSTVGRKLASRVTFSHSFSYFTDHLLYFFSCTCISHKQYNLNSRSSQIIRRISLTRISVGVDLRSFIAGEGVFEDSSTVPAGRPVDPAPQPIISKHLRL